MARQTKKELAAARQAELLEELLEARKDLINAIGYEADVHKLPWQAMTRALETLAGAIRGRVDRGELRVSLGPTYAGYTWPCDVFVPAGDPAAEQIGAAVGFEVVERGWGCGWREIGAAARAVEAWHRWVDGHRERYEAAARDLAGYAGPEGLRNLLFDEGDQFDRLVRNGVVLEQARAIEEDLVSARDRNDDLAVADVLWGLRERCVKHLVEGSWRRFSGSALNNELAAIRGEQLGKVAEMAGALARSLRGEN